MRTIFDSFNANFLGSASLLSSTDTTRAMVMASKDPYPPKNISKESQTSQITQVFESSSPAEINELLDAGASFLGVTIRKTESGEAFVYAVGIPEQITDLPRWHMTTGRPAPRLQR